MDLQDLDRLCRNFHANLKFIYWQTMQEYEKEKQNKDKLPEEKETTLKALQDKMKYYQEAYKKVEILQERRHLTLVGEKGGYKEAYKKMLQIIENKYIPNGEYTSPEVMNSILNTIEWINALCKDYGIEIKKDTKEEQER